MDLTKYYPDIAAKYPAYVTQRELCEICRICPKTAYNLEQQGEIPYTIEQNHLIRSHKIKLTDILAYLYLLTAYIKNTLSGYPRLEDQNLDDLTVELLYPTDEAAEHCIKEFLALRLDDDNEHELEQ